MNNPPAMSPVHDAIEGVLPPSGNASFFGHESIRGFLTAAVGEGRLHHALLFEGPQGVGKATLAFHLAGHLLARSHAGQASDLLKPDFNAPVYRQIAGGTHPALLYISRPRDPKTEKFKTAITVDEIRRVTQFLARTAHDGAWRVVIVDPADDLNRNAANALLKTLEEPPSKVLFILISHSPGRLLPTIKSRCQALCFEQLDETEMRLALAGSGVAAVDEAAMNALIARSEGSVRQAALMVAHGGLEIADTTDAILDGQAFDVPKAQALASALSGRESEAQYELFLDHLLNRLATAAEAFAMRNEVDLALRWSQLWEKMRSEAYEASAYNLDRRQTVMIFLNRAHLSFREGMPV
ncbi:MAG: DNA polymerase III subunit delta' [Phyllobacterium sp.]